MRLVGVVSRSDLLRHRLVRDPRAHLRPAPEDDTEPPRTVADVMTKDVLALPPSADEADAAQMMLERRVRSLPVVEDGRVVGMVSTTDLLRAAVRGDERIAADVRARFEEAAGPAGAPRVDVQDGVVTISGASSADDAGTLRLLAETVPGVVRVRAAGAEVPGSLSGGPERRGRQRGRSRAARGITAAWSCSPWTSASHGCVRLRSDGSPSSSTAVPSSCPSTTASTA